MPTMPHLARTPVVRVVARSVRLSILGLGSIGFLGLVAGCTSSAPQQASVIDSAKSGSDTQQSAEIRKSPADDRNYRFVTLPNQLRTLLVSDVTTDKAAASLTVLRGSFHEPKEVAGIAHFLEHMLFIGTEKYPEIDGYQNFVSTHGGTSNAYTALDHTNYFFDIQPEFFAPGLDRFAQFFVSPLFDENYVAQEKNAVNSEYQLQMKDDGWRGYMAQKQVFNPSHPASRFTIGSLESLSGDVRSTLLTFFANNYSADQMVLVVLSNESLDALEQMVTQTFMPIKNHAIGPAPSLPPLFNEGQLPAMLKYQTLKDQRSLSFNFPIPAAEKYYRIKPQRYISALLGDEGPGSVHQVLKSQGWIEELKAGDESIDRNTAILSVEMHLTQSGAQHVSEISDVLFSYIGKLQKQRPEKWRYLEEANLSELAFRFQEKSSPLRFVYATAPTIEHYPIRDLLIAGYLMEDFNRPLIKGYLDYLTPQNVWIELSGPDVTTNTVEPWFNVAYQIDKMPPPHITANVNPENRNPQTATLRLPEKNDFIPENLDLVEADSVGPSQQLAKAGLSIWLDTDTEFATPRSNINMIIGVPDGINSAEDFVNANMYRGLVKDSLNELAYPALVAGLGYQLANSSSGFSLSVFGYNDKQPVILGKVLEAFATLTIRADRFAANKEELLRHWGNFKNEKPYTQTFGSLNHLLLSSAWSPQALIKQLQTTNLGSLESWRSKRMQAFSVEALLHGNLTQKDVTKFARLIEKTLPLGDFELSTPKVAQLTQPLRHEIDIDHQDASVFLYVQDPDARTATRARSALAVQLMNSAFFSDLRTEQQLGYVVGVSNKVLRDQGSVGFIVQSPVADPAHLENAITTFVKKQSGSVAALSAEAFEESKQGLISRLTESDKNLASRSSRYWQDLRLDILTFDSRMQLANAVAEISQKEMSEYMHQLVSAINERRLIIYNRGKFDAVPETGNVVAN